MLLNYGIIATTLPKNALSVEDGIPWTVRSEEGKQYQFVSSGRFSSRAGKIDNKEVRDEMWAPFGYLEPCECGETSEVYVVEDVGTPRFYRVCKCGAKPLDPEEEGRIRIDYEHWLRRYPVSYEAARSNSGADVQT